MGPHSKGARNFPREYTRFGVKRRIVPSNSCKSNPDCEFSKLNTQPATPPCLRFTAGLANLPRKTRGRVVAYSLAREDLSSSASCRLVSANNYLYFHQHRERAVCKYVCFHQHREKPINRHFSTICFHQHRETILHFSPPRFFESWSPEMI